MPIDWTTRDVEPSVNQLQDNAARLSHIFMLLDRVKDCMGMKNRAPVIQTLVCALLSAMLTAAIVMWPSPPVYTVEVRCPFEISDADSVTIKTNRGPVELGSSVIQLEHVSEPCPGHTLEIRR